MERIGKEGPHDIVRVGYRGKQRILLACYSRQTRYEDTIALNAQAFHSRVSTSRVEGVSFTFVKNGNEQTIFLPSSIVCDLCTDDKIMRGRDDFYRLFWTEIQNASLETKWEGEEDQLEKKHRGSYNEKVAINWLMKNGWDVCSSVTPTGWSDIMVRSGESQRAAGVDEMLCIDVKSVSSLTENLTISQRKTEYGLSLVLVDPNENCRLIKSPKLRKTKPLERKIEAAE